MDSNLLTINNTSGDVVIKNSLKIDQQLRIMLTGQLLINGIPQWMMVHDEYSDSFDLESWSLLDATASGCSVLMITTCGGTSLLGGYGILSTQILTTSISLEGYTYNHIKVEATFHFIDGWAGQIAYMQLPKSGAYLWTDFFDFTQTKNSLNLCGSDIGEGKFTSNIQVVFNPELGI